MSVFTGGMMMGPAPSDLMPPESVYHPMGVMFPGRPTRIGTPTIISRVPATHTGYMFYDDTYGDIPSVSVFGGTMYGEPQRSNSVFQAASAKPPGPRSEISNATVDPNLAQGLPPAMYDNTNAINAVLPVMYDNTNAMSEMAPGLAPGMVYKSPYYTDAARSMQFYN